jgi:hypothetical protein
MQPAEQLAAAFSQLEASLAHDIFTACLQEGKLGLRWRTEAEVLSGKGQFTCGARGCHEGRGLATFEVPFGYTEAGERKEALVKVSLPVAPHFSRHLYTHMLWKKTKGAAGSLAVLFGYRKAGMRKEGLVRINATAGRHMTSTAHRPTAEMPRQLSHQGTCFHNDTTNREGAFCNFLEPSAVTYQPARL